MPVSLGPYFPLSLHYLHENFCCGLTVIAAAVLQLQRPQVSHMNKTIALRIANIDESRVYPR